jgi:acyl-CoA synthetase (NDP forming)
VTHKHRIISTVAATLFFVAPAALAAQDDSATVGWLLKEIASARGLSAPTEAGSAETLKAAGIAVPSLDPAKQLTERDVVAIGQSLGIDVTTRTPDAPFTKSRGRAFLSAFRDEIAGAGDCHDVTRGDFPGNGNGPPFDPFSKGKKKGHNKSESDPE